MTIYPLGPLDWGAEDTLHKQHCLEVLHLIITLSKLDQIGAGYAKQP